MDSDSAFSYVFDLAKLMVQQGGSDMFITAGCAPVIKIKGEFKRIGHDVLTPENTDTLVRSIMTDRVSRLFDDTHEANFALHLERVARFRVSAFKQRNVSAMVLRLIQSHIPDFEQLHLPAQLGDLSMTKNGLVLFVGGTGSGKSTSLASMVDYRNTYGHGHIITIEDPIEFFHEHKQCVINQREVGTDTESYEVALKNTLRQAPDVILIGEVRDHLGMEAAINFAETGHLVLATLHANNADQAFDRVINFFPSEKREQVLMDLSFNLKAVISQRLIPRCDLHGLVPAVEILLNTPLVAELIFKGRVRDIKEVMQRSAEQGLVTFDQALFQLYEEDKIDYATALRYADSVNNLRLMIKLKSRHTPPAGSSDDMAKFAIEKDGQDDAFMKFRGS